MRLALSLALLPLFACASEQAGIEVSLGLAATTPATLAADNGAAVGLTHGSLALGSLELIACGEEGSVHEGEAHEHGTGLQLQHTEGSPTLLGTSAILALDAEHAGTTLGTIAPPPGRYCTLRQHYLAADDDAVGLADDGDIGATLVATGTVGGAPFSLRTDDTLDLDVTLATPLDLSLDGTRTAALEITLDPAVNWLEGVTFAAGHETDDAKLALSNLHHALGARTKP